MLTLSAVVPATDRPRTVSRCLAAIRGAAHPPDEVIVVDRPESWSPAQARNDGARRASGDIVVFVDADVEVHPDAFTRLRAAYRADPGLDAIFGAYDDEPAVQTTVSAFRNLLHHYVHRTSAGPAATFWSGLGSVRRARFLEVGGFDAARYPHPSIEDIELGDRLSTAGASIRLDPMIQGTHLKHWTLRSMVWTDFVRRGVPWVSLLVRRGRGSRALNLGWRHRASALTCVAGLVTAVLLTPLLLALALGCFVAINRHFYVLLARQQGTLRATAGVGLHALHHLVSASTVPVGFAQGLRDRRLERIATPARAFPAPAAVPVESIGPR